MKCSGRASVLPKEAQFGPIDTTPRLPIMSVVE